MLKADVWLRKLIEVLDDAAAVHAARRACLPG
jgi:hypothetical protein